MEHVRIQGYTIFTMDKIRHLPQLARTEIWPASVLPAMRHWVRAIDISLTRVQKERHWYRLPGGRVRPGTRNLAKNLLNTSKKVTANGIFQRRLAAVKICDLP